MEATPPMTEHNDTTMTLEDAEAILGNLLGNVRSNSGTQKTSPRTANIEARIEKLEQEYEVAEQMSNEVEKTEDTSTPDPASSPTPELRDTTSALARLDKTARRAETLAWTAQRLALIVGDKTSFKGEGPAYMNAAVKALREEIRCYETAIKLAQLLTTRGGYRIEIVRDKSWVKDNDEENVE
jgi:hypothetical protein